MCQNNELWKCFPWIELHVHLRGCMPPDFFVRQFNRYGPHISFEERHQSLFESVDVLHHLLQQETASSDDIRQLFNPASLRDFLLSYLFTGYYIRTIDDLSALIESVISYFKQQSHAYVELTISPLDYVRHDISLEELLECLESYRRTESPIIRWIVDPVRNNGPEQAQVLLEAIAQASVQPFCGMTLGGMEDSFPVDAFHSVYDYAHSMGLGCSIHTGETASPEDVIQALSLPGLTRIGHGLSALANTDACLALIDHGVALEICPSSNVFTGLIDTLGNHPLVQVQHPGLNYTINTDDPAFFHCSMHDEYHQLQACGLTREFLLQTQFAAIQAAFCADDIKNKLHQKVQKACESMPG